MKTTGHGIICAMLLILAVFCCGCGTDSDSPKRDYEKVSAEIITEAMTSEKMGIAIQDSASVDLPTAVEISDIIMREYQDKGFFPGYDYVKSEDCVIDDIPAWVSYYYDTDVDGLSPEFVIAIRKDAFEIVGMWVNEG